MIPTAELRLPGVYFLPPAPRPAPGLPPLDVAAFVGFAERGPLHTPVGLEDADAYRDVFGGDVALARSAGDVPVLANLPAAVRSFFASGGRRCYVVRVAADTARRGRLLLPGMVAVGTSTPRRVAVDAAWEGRWADRLSLATRADVTALPPEAFSVAAGDTLLWRTALVPVRSDFGTAPQAVEVGDVLRLTFEQGEWLFPVARVVSVAVESSSPPNSPAAAAPRPLALVAARSWRLTRVDPASPPLRVADLVRVGEASEPLGITAYLYRRGAELALDLGPLAVGPDRPRAVAPGDVLALDLPDGSRHLFPVQRVTAEAVTGSPPLRVAIAFADAMLAVAPAPLPVASPPTLTAVERLRFDLLVWEGIARHPALLSLAFNRGHGRFWGDTAFLESSPRYRRPTGRGEDDLVARAVAIYRRLRSGRRLDADPLPAPARRPPHEDGPDGGLGLAGLAARLAPIEAEPSDATYLPLGMAGVFDEAARTGPIDPGADGLESFDAALFVDPALIPDPAIQPRSGDALLAEAFHRHYVENRRLRALHSLLPVGEVALLAVPDATHGAWSRAIGPAPVGAHGRCGTSRAARARPLGVRGL
jgi:hypothetical protein